MGINYKFKNSVAGYMFFIDDSVKTEFKIGTRYKKELAAYLVDGNEIEPQFTAEELAEKEAEEVEQYLLSQSQQCKNLLDETQHKVNGDYDKPAPDVLKWKAWRVEIKAIMRSSTIQEIPGKPF